MSPVTEFVESIIEMPEKFADVALQGPIEAILVAFGAVFVAVPSLILLYLVLGAGVDLVRSGPTGPSHPGE